jgi:hypothetical protein
VSSSSSAISEIERWYANQCDGHWEHSHGVKIDTLDNPGWRVHIDLQGTRRQEAKLETIKIKRADDDWVQYWVDKMQFNIACGPKNLSEAVGIFLCWFDGT